MDELKTLKDQKKPQEEFILKFMNETEENEIGITGGKIVKNKTESKTGMTKDFVRDILAKDIKDEKLVSKILENLEKRPTKVNYGLKRTSERKKVLKKKE